MSVFVEGRGSAVVAWAKGTKHRLYEDRYRLLPISVPIVSRNNRGELFAVFDGIGSAPKGMSAAQEMADRLVFFYNSPEQYGANWEGLRNLLMDGNEYIHQWGLMEGTDRPLGGCAGTIAWIHEKQLTVFHAGDTVGVLISGRDAIQLTKIHQKPDGAIYRYFGLGPNLRLEVKRCRVEESDWVLLMSDGITKVFHPMEAAAYVHRYNDLLQGVRELVQESQIKGSPDDITVVLVDIGAEQDEN